jgi:hypothetical protein
VILALAGRGRDPVAHVDGSITDSDSVETRRTLPVAARAGSHEEPNPMIRRYIAWRNRHKDNEALRDISIRAKLPDAALDSA